MTRLSGAWLGRANTQAIAALLTDAGFQTLFVGGCVRNALLGVAVNDIDIATDAHPDRVMALAKKAGIKAIPTGFDHGTVTLVLAGAPFEITTFRRDVETDGRRAVVAFSDSIQEDARRRDFTMNALYAKADGTVVDPLNGLADVLAGRVRFIEDADARIREDYLRILRFFRFHAWYGDASAGLDAEGLAACAANIDGLETLSAERVGAELLKLLAAANPSQSLAAMAQCGALAQVMPGAEAKTLSVLVHLEDIAKISPNPIRRLAALGGESVAKDLRLSKSQARQLFELREAIGSAAGSGELGYRLGQAAAQDILLLRAAVFEQPIEAGALGLTTLGASAVFPVKAADLMPAFQGPALGAEMKRLERKWIESQFSLSHKALLA